MNRSGTGRFSLSTRFNAFSLIVLLAGMAVIGYWLQVSVRNAVISRTAAVTSLYVDSFVRPILQRSPVDGVLGDDARSELDQLMKGTPLGAAIASMKIWSPSGTILYSPNPDLIGRSFAIGEDLRRALDGEIVSRVSALDEPENEFERQKWDSLIETYAPIRGDRLGQVIAVNEFYQLPGDLIAEVRDAERRSWALVGLATLVMYLVLVGMVRRASTTIDMQRNELVEHVDHLRSAAQENRRLQSRVGRAAARATTLNEKFLGRLSSDIHDGPAQDVALALLRIDHIDDGLGPEPSEAHDDVMRIRAALVSALEDLRAITHGLHAPDVGGLSPCDAARRAVTDLTRIVDSDVAFDCEETDAPGPLPVNITIYRVVQESLANSLKHADATSRSVRVGVVDRVVEVSIEDDGQGIEGEIDWDGATLGLAGMRERVELLGGTFSVTSGSGLGTVVTARIPLENGVVHG